MKRIGLAALLLAYGFGMFLLGRNSQPGEAGLHEQALTQKAEQQTEHLALILTRAKTLPASVAGGNWKSETEAWSRVAGELSDWCRENPQHAHEDLAAVAQGSCAAVLDLLKAPQPGNTVAEAVCNRSMEKTVAQNADILSILLRKKRAPRSPD